jgi:integrase
MGRPTSGTVEFRGNPPRWFARVTTKDANGAKIRPWVDLERPDLKDDRARRADGTVDPKGQHGPDYRTAKREAAKRAKAARKGTFVGVEVTTAPKLKLEELEEKWFALLDGDPHLKSGTRTTYKSCWTSRGKPHLGKHPVAALTVPLLRGWVRELTGELSPSSVRNNAIAVTRFLSDARAEGWITLDANPMKHEDVRAMLPSVQAPDAEDIVLWTKSEAETLLASKLPDDRFGLYLVAFLSGLRAGELRGLTFAHVMLDAKIPMLRVRDQLGLARVAGETATRGTPKTRSSKRDVPLHHAALAWLTWWRDEGWTAHVGRPRTDDEPVFPAVDGEAGRPRDANILRRDLKAAKLSEDFVTPDGERLPYTFHATRRTFSRLLGDNGVSAELVGMLCGHAGKSVTERHYMGRSVEAMTRAVTSLSLTLPERPGVSPVLAIESSCESSQPETADTEQLAEVLELQAFRYEQPMELPQFRHL